MKPSVHLMSTTYLLTSINKLSRGLFCSGFCTALSLVLAGSSSKQNGFQGVLSMTLSTVLFLALSIFLYYQLSKTFIPEIRKRIATD